MKNAVVFTLLTFLAFVLYGCGSGDFSNSSGASISGVASKGPINGAKVAIFSVTTSGRIDKQLATTITGSNGAYTANIGSYTGAVFTSMSGSSASYTDETTGAATALGAQKLHAVSVILPTSQDPNGLTKNLAITPLTELAYQKAATLRPADITAANTLISNLFLQGASIITTLPANILSSSTAVTTNADKIDYSLVLAAFSKLISTSDIATGVTQLGSAISGGTFTAPAAWTTAVASVASNTNLQSGIASVPAAVTFVPATYTAIINQPLTITANVTKFDGTPVPAGTSVTFTASGGTLGTPTATDASGNATVTLTTSAAGTTITVNASATASGVTVSTKTAAVVNVITDPNAPGSVTLATSSSSVVVNQSVTLTAKVGVVGGANNVTAGSPPPVGTVVTFKITSGTGTLGTATTTDASGNATVTLTSGTAGAVAVTASAGTITSSPVQVTFTSDPAAPATVTVSASKASIPADGATTSTITVNVKNFVPTALSGVPVTLSAAGGTLSATSGTTDSSGNVAVTLTSTTAGTATVTASATAAGVTKTGSTTVTITALPTKAIVILSTSGTFTSGTTIGAINCDLTFPTAKGVTFSTAVLSGVSTSVTPNPSLASNVATAGDVSIALSAGLSGSTTVGFPLGQFVTATFAIGNTQPVTSDFAVAAGSEVDNTSGVAQSGISVTILSVTFQ
ncbi:MAG: Ig-like domain-containing protein [Oryzomonas sp.]|jgi:adhesin/invasin